MRGITSASLAVYTMKTWVLHNATYPHTFSANYSVFGLSRRISCIWLAPTVLNKSSSRSRCEISADWFTTASQDLS